MKLKKILTNIKKIYSISNIKQNTVIGLLLFEALPT